jgi:chemotaxis protein MotB
MVRLRRSDDPVNHERWLVSYADLVTLMFAFFVVMFAASQADKQKVRQVSESVARALEQDRVGSRIRHLLGGAAGDAGTHDASPVTGKPLPQASGKMAELLPSMQHLSAELEEEIKSGKLHINLEPRGLVISLKQAAFFPTGDDTVSPAVYSIMEKLATVIRKLPNPVRLEGHTDAVPISNGRFASNWHLSVARSIAMLELLTSRYGIPPSRLAVVGYGDTVPVDANTTEEGRGRNRRVDITILNQTWTVSEPGNK